MQFPAIDIPFMEKIYMCNTCYNKGKPIISKTSVRSQAGSLVHSNMRLTSS